jgi:uncharacterized protein (DUF1684 family)
LLPEHENGFGMMNYRSIAVASLLFSITYPCALPQTGPASEANWRRDLLTWRDLQAKKLQAPDGWLSLAGLEWLNEGDNMFGSASDNRIRIQADVAAHLGVLRLSKNAVSLVSPSVGFPQGLLLDGHPPRAQVLASEETPNILTDGTLSMVVIHRGDGYALRLKDSHSSARLHFRGLKWYAPNEKYRVSARWIPYAPAKIVKIPTILGTTIEMPVPGVAEFLLAGQTLRLEPVLESPKGTELFFILRDTTSRTMTYGAARFLYTTFPDQGLNKPGKLWLDFNRLENPPCAYTAYATCPLPPPQNRLTIALPAGEQRYHD